VADRHRRADDDEVAPVAQDDVGVAGGVRAAVDVGLARRTTTGAKYDGMAHDAATAVPTSTRGAPGVPNTTRGRRGRARR
jgi:hypothetical protein